MLEFSAFQPVLPLYMSIATDKLETIRQQVQYHLDHAERNKLSPEQEQEIYRKVARGESTAAQAAREHGIHPSTVSRLLERMRDAEG